MTLVKICGLSTPETLDAALDAGADMVGFVFFSPSPRNLSMDAARELACRVHGRAKTVALTVNADDATIDAIVAAVAPDLLQLHGAETPERADALRARTGRPVMKSVGVGASGDVAKAREYRDAADVVLFDAKPPDAAVLPGGNGRAFDWSLLRDIDLAQPWMLSGGLQPGNVGEAMQVTGAPMVDVSSGVEVAPGVKNPALIRAFISAVRASDDRRGRLSVPCRPA